MMRVRLGLVVAAACVPAVTGGQNAPGLSVSIELSHASMVGEGPGQGGVFLQGRPIEVTFTITNGGQEPYQYADRNGDRGGRMPEYAVEVLDAEGRKLDDPRELVKAGGTGGGLAGHGEIGPGETFQKGIYLNKWVMPLQPGRYTAVGTYDQSWGEGHQAPTSEPVEFEVVAVSDDEMRAYIHELGAMVPNSAGERLQRVAESLAFTGNPWAWGPLNDAMYQGAWPARRAYLYVADRDRYRESLLQSLNQRGPADGMVWVLWVPLETPPERIVAGLAKAIAENIDPEIRARAARELSFPETGEAGMKPLLTAIEDDEPEVRASAASALRFYEGEEATNAILAASTDRHPDVRAMAASSLAHRRPERAVPRLTEMLDDERENVAKEAARALALIDERAAKQ